MKKVYGIRDSLRKNGINEDIPMYFCEEATGCGYDITRQIIEEHPETDAIYYSSDVFAVAGMRMLQEMNIRVPEDMGVISGEESPYSTQSHPLITSLDSKIEDISMQACRNMIDILQGKQIEKTMSADCEINERETTK